MPSVLITGANRGLKSSDSSSKCDAAVGIWATIKIVLRGLDEHGVIFEWPNKKP